MTIDPEKRTAEIMRRYRRRKYVADNQEKRAEKIERMLMKQYGLVVSGKNLRHLLGYRTGDAFRQAVKRQSLPFYTFIPEGRRARMARVKDIAQWLASIEADMDEVLKTDETEKE